MGRIASGPASPTPCSPRELGRIVGAVKMAPAAFQLMPNFGICGGARLNLPSMVMVGSLSLGSSHLKSKKPFIFLIALSTASRAPLMVFVMFVYRSKNHWITPSMVVFSPSKTPFTKSIAIPMLSKANSTAA